MPLRIQFMSLFFTLVLVSLTAVANDIDDNKVRMLREGYPYYASASQTEKVVIAEGKNAVFSVIPPAPNLEEKKCFKNPYLMGRYCDLNNNIYGEDANGHVGISCVAYCKNKHGTDNGKCVVDLEYCEGTTNTAHCECEKPKSTCACPYSSSDPYVTTVKDNCGTAKRCEEAKCVVKVKRSEGDNEPAEEEYSCESISVAPAPGKPDTVRKD